MKVKSFIKNFIFYFCWTFAGIMAVSYLYSLIVNGAGTIDWSKAIPVALIIGSVYSLIPAAIAIVAVIIRTYLEDRTLQNELAGYSEYVRRTKYMLAPDVW